jgi:oligopeptide transport system ATP-binding protein
MKEGIGPLLDVRGLHVRFRVRRSPWSRSVGHRRAVDDVSFQIGRGETLGLVGESGCGKSTTARAVLRLVESAAGEVLFDGDDVRMFRRAELRAFRRRAQIVFQDPFGSLNPRSPVGAALEEALRAHNLGDPSPRDRAVALLERVGLRADHASRYPHEFSGGQRQRIGIARALSVEPELIILDEPVSALDVSVRAQVVNLLDDLREELGLTYLFIAHDLALVEHVSDRVAVMYHGRIVEVGPARALCRAPLHPYTKALLAAAPRPDPSRRGAGTRMTVPGEVPSRLNPPSGCPFHARCGHPAKDTACTHRAPRLEPTGDGRSVACPKALLAPVSGG